MKKLMMAFAACLCLTVAKAQDSTQAGTNFTKEELEVKGKITLTQIFLTQLNSVVNKMPTSVFNGSNFSNDVPQNKYINKRLASAKVAMQRFNANMIDSYKDIVPYADKQDIIDEILYLQQIINKL